MNYKNIILGVLFSVLFFSCRKDWKDHYNTEGATVNMNLWEAIQQNDSLSLFVEYTKKYHYDTLFLTDNPYTLFIPDNTALRPLIDSDSIAREIVGYAISEYFLQSGMIDGKSKIQTISEKFAIFERHVNESFFDGIPLTFESPLYQNGKYFVMKSIAYPKLNLYEYYKKNNLILTKYIDSQDSLILDKTKSKPLGFDQNGNTIYDTVGTIYNKFESEFFPVREETRFKTATIVFPKETDYNNGLTMMAQALGGNYHDYHDIPADWQNKILIPYLLEHGVFENMLEKEEFDLTPHKDTLKNILGDSIVIDYEPGERTICSNGYAYNYVNFRVPDTLYAASLRKEGESLVRSIGKERYTWLDNVKALSTISLEPKASTVKIENVTTQVYASNDSIVSVGFPTGYTGSFSLEFNFERLFPRKYLMAIRTKTDMGGIYKIYVNDILVKTIDYKDLGGAYVFSVNPPKRYFPEKGGFIIFDCWVNNILTEYNQTKIRFEYAGPSSGSTVRLSGLAIDYIDFKPYK